MEVIHAQSPHYKGHFADFHPFAKTVKVYRGALLLIETKKAIELREHFGEPLAFVHYLPREDVKARLEKNQQMSHCPLKGEASYYDLVDDAGKVIEPSICWSYENPTNGTDVIAGYLSFDLAKARIEIG